MQPSPQKPIMDVTAPPQPAAAAEPVAPAPLAVHAAPAREETSKPPEAPLHSTPTPQPTAPSPTSDPEPVKDTAALSGQEKPSKGDEKPAAAPVRKPANANPAPVGAIVGAILGMIVLSAIAVAIYLNA